MTDLDASEQANVRIALRYLRITLKGWQSVGKALGFQADTMQKVAAGVRSVTAPMAFRIAKMLGASIDDLISGRYLHTACTRCGYVIDGCSRCGHKPDFTDDHTAVEDAPRSAPNGGGLKLVK